MDDEHDDDLDDEQNQILNGAFDATKEDVLSRDHYDVEKPSKDNDAALKEIKELRERMN